MCVCVCVALKTKVTIRVAVQMGYLGDSEGVQDRKKGYLYSKGSPHIKWPVALCRDLPSFAHSRAHHAMDMVDRRKMEHTITKTSNISFNLIRYTALHRAE